MIEYRFRVPSAAVFTLYSYSKALQYLFRVPTAAGSLIPDVNQPVRCLWVGLLRFLGWSGLQPDHVQGYCPLCKKTLSIEFWVESYACLVQLRIFVMFACLLLWQGERLSVMVGDEGAEQRCVFQLAFCLTPSWHLDTWHACLRILQRPSSRRSKVESGLKLQLW
jgi:hypothetical protein